MLKLVFASLSLGGHNTSNQIITGKVREIETSQTHTGKDKTVITLDVDGKYQVITAWNADARATSTLVEGEKITCKGFEGDSGFVLTKVFEKEGGTPTSQFILSQTLRDAEKARGFKRDYIKEVKPGIWAYVLTKHEVRS